MARLVVTPASVTFTLTLVRLDAQHVVNPEAITALTSAGDTSGCYVHLAGGNHLRLVDMSIDDVLRALSEAQPIEKGPST